MAVERISIVDESGKIDRARWLALRAQDITASDVPAVCGEGLYNSAAKVWAEKRGLIPAQEMTDAMLRGLWGEAAVFEALAWNHPDWELRRAKVYMRDPDRRLGATPDGAAIMPERKGVVVVQCKIIAEPIFKAEWLENPDDDIEFGQASAPVAYQLQTLTETKLADACAGLIAVLVVGTFKWTLREFWIERHPDAEAIIDTRVASFWRDYLDPGVQPPFDPARDGDLVKQLYPQDDGTEIDLSADNRILELVTTLDDAKASRKAAQEMIDVTQAEITGKLGSHTYGRLLDGRTISWKTQHRGGYQVEATSFRVLRIAKGSRR